MLAFEIHDTHITECMALLVMLASHKNRPVMNYQLLKE